MALVDEKLLELTEDNERMKLELVAKDGEIEQLQLDSVQKIAKAKIDFETKEIDYKKQIKEVTLSLEMRNSNTRETERLTNTDKKSVNQMWEEVTGDTK